jgi:hypothetical protein
MCSHTWHLPSSLLLSGQEIVRLYYSLVPPLLGTSLTYPAPWEPQQASRQDPCDPVFHSQTSRVQGLSSLVMTLTPPHHGRRAEGLRDLARSRQNDQRLLQVSPNGLPIPILALPGHPLSLQLEAQTWDALTLHTDLGSDLAPSANRSAVFALKRCEVV